MSAEPITLTAAQLDALHVLALGMASRSAVTVTDRTRYLHAVNSAAATALIKLGLARDVRQWRAVELTDEGRRFLASVAQ